MECVCAVIFDGKGRFLLVYNPKRRGWELPGGKIEKNEKPEDAIKRELSEEVGIEVNGLYYVGKNDCHLFTCIYDDTLERSDAKFFRELPHELSFSKKEYEDVLYRSFNFLKELGCIYSSFYELS